MAGFSVADFFATLSIKADTKQVAKIEAALKKVNTSLKAIGASSVAQANKMDKAFSGDILRKKQLQIEAAHEALKKMGVSMVDFDKKLKGTATESQFLKMSNDIKRATIDARKLKGEITGFYKTEKLLGGKKFANNNPFSPFGAQADVEFMKPFDKPDDYLDKTKAGRKLMMHRTAEQQKALRDLAKELAKNKVATDTATASLKKLAQEQDRATRASSRATQQLKKQNQIMRRMKSSAMQLAQSFVGAFAVFESVRSINRVGQDFEGMKAAMIASSGSSRAAADDLAFVDREAVRLGLDLRETTDAYAKLQFASKGKMSKENLRGLFVGFSEFATSLKVNPEQQKAGLRALQQMLNKTTVMSEELKQQLAEQVPGSIQIFARAAGVTEKELFKMMEAGTIVSSEILPAVGREFAKAAREGGALGEALKTVRVQQGRFTTELQKSQDTIFKGGFGVGYATFLEKMAILLVELEPIARLLGQVFHILIGTASELVKAIAAPIVSLGKVLDLFGLLNQVGGKFADDTAFKITTALILMTRPIGILLAKFLLVKSAIEEVIALTTKGVMAEAERRIGADIGFIDLSSNQNSGKGGMIQPPPEQGFTEALLTKGILGAFDNTFGTNSRDALIEGIKDSVKWALGSTEVSVNSQITIDEFGLANSTGQLRIESANAQAQR